MIKLQSGNSIDVNLLKSRPTWRNRGMGEARVAKRLDRFLLKEEMANQTPFFKQWVGTRGDSDHLPILLELKGPSRKPRSPFKFNPAWLKDPSYNSLVKETWRPLVSHQGSSPTHSFMENLKGMKKEMIE